MPQLVVMMGQAWSPDARVEVFFNYSWGTPPDEYSWRKNISEYFSPDGTITKDSLSIFNMVYPDHEEVIAMVNYLVKLKHYSNTFHLAISLESFLQLAE